MQFHRLIIFMTDYTFRPFIKSVVSQMVGAKFILYLHLTRFTQNVVLSFEYSMSAEVK